MDCSSVSFRECRKEMFGGGTYIRWTLLHVSCIISLMQYMTLTAFILCNTRKCVTSEGSGTVVKKEEEGISLSELLPKLLLIRAPEP